MNPFDAVGTARVSQAIADRMCRVVLGYQDEAGEQAITAAVSGLDGAVVELVGRARPGPPASTATCGWARRCAARSTCVLVLTGLRRAARRGRTPARETARDAAYAALSGRIRVADGVDRTPESVIDELLDRLLARRRGDPDRRSGTAEGKADGPPAEPPAASAVQPRGGTAGREQRAAHASAAPQLAAAARGVRRRLARASASSTRTAFDAPLAADPDAAAALLADLAVATDGSCGRPPAGSRPGSSCSSGRVGPAQRARGTRRLVRPAALDGRPRPGPHARRAGARAVAAARRRRPGDAHLDRAPAGGLPGGGPLGSMQGLAVAVAAVAAAGVVLAARPDGRAAAVACSRSAAGVRVLQAQGVRRPPEELVVGAGRRCAGTAPPTSPPRCASVATQLAGGGGRRARGRAAVGLPAHRRRGPGRGARRASTGCTCSARCRPPEPRGRRRARRPRRRPRPAGPCRSPTSAPPSPACSADRPGPAHPRLTPLPTSEKLDHRVRSWITE